MKALRFGQAMVGSGSEKFDFFWIGGKNYKKLNFPVLNQELARDGWTPGQTGDRDGQKFDFAR